MTATRQLDAVLAACDERRERDLDDLKRLLRQPSISAQNVGVRECAALVASQLAADGFAVQTIATPGHPMIVAAWRGAPGKPTVLIYGHYDVQPPDPLDAW